MRGDFNTTLSSIDRTFGQNRNNDISELNKTVDKIGLIDIYRIFHTTSAD
jgi:hypothetical protein